MNRLIYGWIVVGSWFVVGSLVPVEDARAQSPVTELPPIGDPSARRDLAVSAYEGYAMASRDITISSQETGRIVSLPVEVGDRVQRGDVIAKLDDAIQAASVRVAQIQADMRGDWLAAVANRDAQARRLENLRQLARDDMAGAEELSRAELELEIAEARVISASEQQRQRVAELERLKLQWQRRTIVAPFTGVVAQRLLSEGSSLLPGNASLVRLLQTDVLHGRFNLPAREALPLQVGQEVQVYLRTARRTVNAKIDVISPTIDAESGTIAVRVAIDNQDGHLQPGDRITMRVLANPAPPKSSAESRAAVDAVGRWGRTPSRDLVRGVIR